MPPPAETSCPEHVALSRRRLLAAGAAAATSLAMWSHLPKAVAGTRDPRLLVVILRGGLDGMALASPAGDPQLVALRHRHAIQAGGEGAGLALDGFFVLNPAMGFLHGLYQKREALIVHAVATPYRERSHFDGQDVLESGLAGVGRSDSGWLNRALAGLVPAAAANPQGMRKGLAMGAVVPLMMRGAAPVLTWIPKTYGQPLRESTIARLADLYAHTDKGLAKAFAEGIEIEQMAGMSPPAARRGPAGPGEAGTTPPAQHREFVETAQTAARLMSSADGPRVGVLSYNGWDTHANEGALRGQLANRLGGLDAAIRAYAEGMGAAWQDTVALIVTEFGRTARINGTEGTDHGTATVAVLAGGAVKGGRVLTDWPGLSALHEGRDLKPTRDLRAVLKGVLRDHLGVPAGALASSVFPSSAGVAPADGLLG